MWLRGATLTLTKRDGGFLTAFIALFVTVVARSFWRLFCFVAHSSLSVSTSRDGLYHQTQAILRNADESIIGLKYLGQLAWHWRRKAQRPWYRIIPLLGTTIAITISFYIASIFSSQVRSTREQALVSTRRRARRLHHH